VALVMAPLNLLSAAAMLANARASRAAQERRMHMVCRDRSL
jgi:hypothetical protein